MKRIILLLAVLALSFGAFSCGGGGAGSSDSPSGENPGIPSLVQLSSSHVIAQTNSNITLRAKVLDGNGIPVRGVAVTFTNLSEPLGILKPLTASSAAVASSATVAVTDGQGLASLNLYSTTPGFVTIVAQVYNGVGTVRDRKSFYFTSKDVVAVSMNLDVDSVPGNNVFNEVSDVTLFQDPPIPQPDDTVKVRATVRDGGGVPVGGGMGVTWSTSHAEAVILRPDTMTNVFGVAESVVQVTPSSIRNTDTFVNVMAFADNGAANMVTLFLRPVVIDSTKSTVTATPDIVALKGTSNVTAVVFLNTGARAPDGIVVNFSTAPKTPGVDPTPCGTITPFVPLKSGVTDPPATFTAPAVPGTCTVTARSGGVTIGSVDILVIEPLSVQPSAQTIDGVAGGIATFTIFGGVPAYTITSDNVAFQPTPATVTASGGTFTVTVPANTATTAVKFTIKDKTGTTVTATLNITGQALAIFPNTASVHVGATVTLTIFGGAAPYTAFTSDPVNGPIVLAGNVVTVGPILGTICTPDPGPPVVPCTATITITVRDNKGATATATINVTNP